MTARRALATWLVLIALGVLLTALDAPVRPTAIALPTPAREREDGGLRIVPSSKAA